MSSGQLTQREVQDYKDVILIVVYNKKPNVYKNSLNEGEQSSKPHNRRDEIKKMSNAWIECPFKDEQLNKIFEIDSLRERVKFCETFSIDIFEAKNCKTVFTTMSKKINQADKERKKEDAKKQ